MIRRFFDSIRNSPRSYCCPLHLHSCPRSDPLDDIFKFISPITWRTFIPTHVTGEAYVSLFTERGFGRTLFNSFFTAMVEMLFGLLVGSMAAFAFAFFKFRGENAMFVLVLITFMIPFEMIAIPLYSLVDQLGWMDSYTAIIVPGIENGLVIFLYRQFFMELSPSLTEAARLDGASWFRIYTKIIMPLCKPVTLSAGLSGSGLKE